MNQLFVLGDDQEDPAAPAAVLLDMPPGYVMFRHAHPCHRVEVVVKGSLRVGDETLGPGDVMTAAPGEWYGPHVAGAEGCTSVEIFSTLDGVFTVFARSADGQPREFDFRSGEVPPEFQDLEA